MKDKMKHIKNFKIFEKELTYIEKDVKIRFEIEASNHVMDRKYRHGPGAEISESDIIEVIENSIEELTIAMMQGRLVAEERFIIKNKETNLNIVAVIYSGKNEFKLVILTIMTEENFKT